MERGYAATRIGQLHFATAGRGSASPPLILLPQGGRSWPMFERLMALLSPRRTCVAVDYPGSGGSDPLPAGSRFEDIAAALVDLLDQLGISRACLYGIHTGNKIATAFAAANPERVERLVLAGQSHSLVPSNSRRAGTVGKTRRKLLEEADERETALVHWADVFSNVSAQWWGEDLMRRIADPAARRRAIVKAADEIRSSESIRTLYRANFAYDLENDLARIAARTLVIEIATPSEDHAIGRQGEALLARIPDARLVTLEKPDRHGITLEDDAEELAEILEAFLGA